MSGQVVLIVDDDESRRHELLGALQQLELSIDIAADGEAAVEKIESNEYGLVLLDIGLSGADGWRVLRRLRHIHPHVPIVLMTEGPSVEDVVDAMHHHRLRITDIKPAPDDIRREFSNQEFLDLDVTSFDQLRRAAAGMDAIVNLSVIRRDPRLAFHVNTLGCYHVMQAAVEHGIRRVINTGPHFTVAGPAYEHFDHGINPDVPPHPGTGLYPLTKSLGQEVCRTLAEDHDIYVQTYLFYSFRNSAQLKPGRGGVPFVVAWSDAAEVFRLGLEVDLAKLPSKCEVFFILGDVPQGKFLNDKAKRILGFAAKQAVSVLWQQP
jgi:CheY-like chemotaxis protein